MRWMVAAGVVVAGSMGAGVVSAQTAAGRTALLQTPPPPRMGGGLYGGLVTSSSVLTKGLPYSLRETIITVRTQGENTITHTDQRVKMRDAEGRTRTQGPTIMPGMSGHRDGQHRRSG